MIDETVDDEEYLDADDSDFCARCGVFIGDGAPVGAEGLLCEDCVWEVGEPTSDVHGTSTEEG